MTDIQKQQVRYYFKQQQEERIKLVAEDIPAAMAVWDDDSYDRQGELIAQFEQGIEQAARGYPEHGGPMAAYVAYDADPMTPNQANKRKRGGIPRMPVVARNQVTLKHREKNVPFTLVFRL